MASIIVQWSIKVINHRLMASDRPMETGATAAWISSKKLKKGKNKNNQQYLSNTLYLILTDLVAYVLISLIC